MEDLTAASHDDVVAFFKTYYAPNNASLVVAGDIDLDKTRALVEKWFGEIPRGADVVPVAPPAAQLTGVKRKTLKDRVQLAAALSRLADAAALRARRRGARRASPRARRRQELAALQAARLRPADRAGRVGISSVGRARQLVPDRRDGPARAHGRGAESRHRRGARALQSEPPDGARGRARAEPDRGVVLPRHGARRRVRRQSRPAQRLLRGRRRARLLRRGPRALHGADARRRAGRSARVVAGRRGASSSSSSRRKHR